METLELVPTPLKQLQTRASFPEASPVVQEVQIADELGFAYLVGDIDFGAVGRDEIFQNIRFIILTEYFSTPLDREFGFDYSMIDKPMAIAEAIFAQEVALKISLYEPRAQFRSIDYVRDEMVGKLSPSVVVALLTTEELPSAYQAPATIAGGAVAAPIPAAVTIATPQAFSGSIVGLPGSQGPAGTMTVGTTTTGPPGSDALVINSGSPSSAILDFTIPEGEKGDQGTGITIKGTVANHAALPSTGQQPGDMWITADTGHGWAWDGTAWVDCGPIQGPVGPTGPTGATGGQGAVGPAGAAATIAVGTTITGAAGTNANVVNVGSSSAATFNFTIPQGIQGIQGVQGAQGVTGPANVLSVSSTTTSAPGTNANVTISGTSPAQSLAFTIPRGDVGAQGAQGSQGIQGIQGAPGQVWRGTWSASTNYILNDAVEYQGSTFICTTANINSPPIPDTGSNWLPPLANTGNRGSIAALRPSNQTSYYARGDNTWALFPISLSGLATDYIDGTGASKASSSVVPVGGVLQTRYIEFSANTSVVIIPTDGTTPQITEGQQIAQQSITPLFANSLIRVSVETSVYNSIVNCWATLAVFRNPNANSIVWQALYLTAATGAGAVAVNKFDTPATTSSITYSIRIGPGVAATSTISPYSSGGILTLQEIKQ